MALFCTRFSKKEKKYLLKRLGCDIITSVDSDSLKTQGYRQVGKARVSESRMRWFESSYPCHMKMSIAQAMLFLYLWAVAQLKNLEKKSRLLLTNGCNSCNIIQVAARYRPARKQDNVPWLETLAECGTASFQTKKKNKKVLDSPKEMRYNKWVAWSKAFQTKANFKRQSCSLKTKQCNMNHLWFKPDVFKNIDWLWT